VGKLKIKFCGANNTVTGSRHLVEINGRKILVDCGLYQGLKELRQRNWDMPPFDPVELDAVLLTHAHLDHTGYLPKLVREGFTGKVFAQEATRDLCKILLPDSGHLQEEYARYANKKGFSKHSPAMPLYTEAEAKESLKLIRGVPFEEPQQIIKGVKATWYKAGHILGASSIMLEAEGGKILFSGDIGRFTDDIMPKPMLPNGADYLLMESTYGNREHKSDDPTAPLAEIVNKTAERNGVLVIPAFAVGRTQIILHTLKGLEDDGLIPRLPVAVNSPMAVDVTGLYRQHDEAHNLEMKYLLETGQAPFSPAKVRFCKSVEESKALHNLRGPAIIISASGMLTGGRILHHLVNRAGDPRNTILLVGYQAEGTRGRSLLDGENELKIFGKYWPVRADVTVIDGFSAHADRRGLLTLLENLGGKPKKT